MMTVLKFKDRLVFNPKEGKILLGDDRMLLLRTSALAILYKQIKNHLGDEISNSILFRFGYEQGFGDYSTNVDFFGIQDELEKISLGPKLHSDEGVVYAEANVCEFDKENGSFYMSGVWKNSYEAEIFKEEFGISRSPSCFTLMGYASGWTSAFMGSPMLAIEKDCESCGSENCSWEIKPVKEWGDEALEFKVIAACDYESLLTKFKKSQSELSKSKESDEKKELMANLGEVTAGIAHEISSPLNILSGYLGIIKKSTQKSPELYDRLKGPIDKSLRSVDRMAKIIKGLKTLFRNGESDPFINTPLLGIIEDAQTICNRKIQTNKVDLKIDYETFQVSVKCRPVQICQALVNLINNAADALSELEDHASRWIEINIQESDDHIYLKVTDGGHGINEDIKDKIMESFFTTKKFGKGTGLGLSLSKKIMLENSGDLYLDDSSKNTCFVLKIPVGTEEADSIFDEIA